MGAKVEGLTTNRVADRLAFIFPDHESSYFARKLRDWFQKGIIEPIGVGGSGPTAANIYGVEIIYKAAILTQLARCGIGARTLAEVSSAMEKNQACGLGESGGCAERAIDSAISGGGEILIAIGPAPRFRRPEVVFCSREYAFSAGYGALRSLSIMDVTGIVDLVKIAEAKEGAPPKSVGVAFED